MKDLGLLTVSGVVLLGLGLAGVQFSLTPPEPASGSLVVVAVVGLGSSLVGGIGLYLLGCAVTVGLHPSHFGGGQ